jgi:hypothetical protein
LEEREESMSDYTSRYNVFDADGQVRIAAGDPIDETEAVRQGIVAPKQPEPTKTAPKSDKK